MWFRAPCRQHHIDGGLFAGTAVVLKGSAALWVEGRYMLQAEEQLDCNWVLMNGGQTDVPVIEEWFKSNLHGSSKVAIDSRVVPFQEVRSITGSAKNNYVFKWITTLSLSVPQNGGKPASFRN